MGLFSFTSVLTMLLLAICTCTFLRERFPSWTDAHKRGIRGLPWKFARIGERISPVIAVSCAVMALVILFA
ncbi:MAG: hypothetical protein MHM6MM_001410 [Cercozoa sp. M6MM]